MCCEGLVGTAVTVESIGDRDTGSLLLILYHCSRGGVSASTTAPLEVVFSRVSWTWTANIFFHLKTRRKTFVARFEPDRAASPRFRTVPIMLAGDEILRGGFSQHMRTHTSASTPCTKNSSQYPASRSRFSRVTAKRVNFCHLLVTTRKSPVSDPPGRLRQLRSSTSLRQSDRRGDKKCELLFCGGWFRLLSRRNS